MSLSTFMLPERESLILKHGLASIQRREEGIPTEHEEQILKEQGVSRMRSNRVLFRKEHADEINKHLLVVQVFYYVSFLSFSLDSPTRYSWNISSSQPEGGVFRYSSLDPL